MSEDKSLRQIVTESANIETMLIASGGEITEEIDKALKEVDWRLPEKVDGYSMVQERMAVISDFYKNRAEMFLKMSKAAKAIIDRCDDNLRFAMNEMGVKELHGHDVCFRLVKSNPAVDIKNEDAIDPAYKTVVTSYKIDKKRIAEDLKAGVPVAGAELKQGESLRMFAQKVSK